MMAVRYLVDIGQDVEGVYVGVAGEDAHLERQGKAPGSHTCFRTGTSRPRIFAPFRGERETATTLYGISMHRK
jgi:hypothetical protein